MLKKSVTLTMAFISLFFLCQCETISSTLIEAPKIEFKELKISSLDLQGIEFIATLNADNNNALDLTVDQVEYQMMIAAKPLFSGTTKKPLILKSKQTNLIEIPFEIKFKDAKVAFEEIIINHNNNYLFQGVSHVGLFKVPFSNSGTLNIPKIKF